MSRERVAWLVLCAGFAGFLLLTGAAGAAAYTYWSTATEPRPATLTVIEGIVTIRDPLRLDPIVAAPSQVLKEGETIATNQTSRAFISLYDGSTVTLFQNSEISLSTLRSLKYRAPEDRVAITLRSGRAIVGVAPPIREQNTFVVRSPHGELRLHEGSYSLDVTPQKSELRVRDIGRAELRTPRGLVTASERQRVEFNATDVTGPRPLGVELIRNSRFSAGLSGWNAGYRDLNIPDVTGAVEEAQIDGRSAVRLLRQESVGTWSETFVYQPIGRDISDFLSLALSLEFRISDQSVQGGGAQGSEYPLMIKIDYRTVNGDNAFWVRGFYYTNERGNPTTNGVLVPHDQWVTYTEATNLLALEPKPREILGIHVIGAGHNYDSLVSRVTLLAE